MFCEYQFAIASVAADLASAAYSDEPFCARTALSSALAIVKAVGLSESWRDVARPPAPETESSVKNLNAARTFGSRWMIRSESEHSRESG